MNQFYYIKHATYLNDKIIKKFTDSQLHYGPVEDIRDVQHFCLKSELLDFIDKSHGWCGIWRYTNFRGKDVVRYCSDNFWESKILDLDKPFNVMYERCPVIEINPTVRDLQQLRLKEYLDFCSDHKDFNTYNCDFHNKAKKEDCKD